MGLASRSRKAGFRRTARNGINNGLKAVQSSLKWNYELFNEHREEKRKTRTVKVVWPFSVLR